MGQQVENLEAYQVVERRKISDLNSEGYILKHKKTNAAVTLLLMMMKTRCFTLDFVHRLKTVPVLPTFWSIPYFAAQRIFRLKILL